MKITPPSRRVPYWRDEVIEDRQEPLGFAWVAFGKWLGLAVAVVVACQGLTYAVQWLTT